MMGELVNICAGADEKTLPSSKIRGMLFNTLDHGANEKKIEAAKRMRQKASPKTTMLDSSGYQLLRGEEKGKRLTFDPNRSMIHNGREINLAPRHVMEAAAALSPDYVIGLDFPIRKVKSDGEKTEEFERKLPYNVRWAFESAAEWQTWCPDAKFLLPIQCYKVAQLDRFLKETNGISYDGVSMPLRNLSIPEIALFLVSFYQRDINRVHLLGTSSFPVIALSAYMAKRLFKWVSLDATTWRFAADKGEFLHPDNLSRVKLGPNASIPPGLKNICACPYCYGRPFAEIQGFDRKKKIHVLREHNWSTVEQAFTRLGQNSGTVPQLEKFMLAHAKRRKPVDELVSVLSMVEQFKDADLSILQMLLPTIASTRKRSRVSRQRTSAVGKAPKASQRLPAPIRI